MDAAISRIRFDDKAWQPALTQTGDLCLGAAVAELTEFEELSGLTRKTQFDQGREPIHQSRRDRCSRGKVPPLLRGFHRRVAWVAC